MPVNASRDSARALRVEFALPGSGARIAQMIALAQRGLGKMHRDQASAFVQTARGIRTPQGSVLRGEGDNRRYAAIVALGVNLLPEDSQRGVLGGSTAAELAARTAKRVDSTADTGAVALAAWAAAEVNGRFEPGLFDQLSAMLGSVRPMPTVDTSWILTAALAARSLGDTARLVQLAADRLTDAQGGGGLFPHTLPARASGRFRAHIGCFADQVYPIQALARLSVATDDPESLRRANRCAATICALQGTAGQWWWHYDSRTGEVVEGYPVYSVHQHAMAPMALFDLADAGGTDHVAEVAAGLDWLRTHPEVMEDLLSDQHGVIWRKVGRREPPKAVRSISAVTTALRPGWQLPGLDKVFPPERIDHECRPYELGWLLYAWLTRNAASSPHPKEEGRACPDIGVR